MPDKFRNINIEIILYNYLAITHNLKLILIKCYTVEENAISFAYFTTIIRHKF
jgi:hypothetical protein